MVQKGKIGVTTDNIFPIIKKFLYSDQEIFLREIVSNAVDATQKIKTLSDRGEFKGELGELSVRVTLNKEQKTVTISDRGIGMTAEEVDKYINQIALSSANEFLDKYKDDANAIIGHFGLGFYSSFMVSNRVEIISKSYKDEPAVKWTCDGSPEFTMQETEKDERGTDIVLHIDDEYKEFLEKERIESLLVKYCKFLPVPIIFGKKQDWKEGKLIDTEEDNIINDVNPLWRQKPAGLKDEDYIKFYRDLYPMSFNEEPMFWIHLNVDYPFNLTGILYFPKIKNNLDLQRNKIQLYSNQVYVTDSVEGIVPEFLTLLHGVIDSPDIPLNVSRSYLQGDNNVKKISSHITKKVADKLEELFKKERTQFQEKWDSLKLFIEYGMLTDDKFYDRAAKFSLLKNTEGEYFTFEEYKTLVSGSQTDKNGDIINLYCSNKQEQYSHIEAAKEKGYDVLLMDGQLDVHWVGLLEQKLEKTRFVRVDSDIIDHIIQKEDIKEIVLSDKQKETLTHTIKAQLPAIEKTEFTVDFKALGESSRPVQIVQNEFSRRMKEMAAMQQQMAFYGELPDTYQVVLNTQHPSIKSLIDASKEKDKELLLKEITEDGKIKQMIDLALLSGGMLKGEALSNFVKRSFDMIK
ncbi:MAG: molecular chaperone HtpG [Fermentimonas sp.]|jgi:molecular chaperone HtpG|uniref:molecular chaperone HtpG n=1 Tax=Lascolabacillus sp. TaxID=1924068 RepID=UPI000AE53175|nr:molecular chaperone HtpG [Lascolabacillus sp.]MBP6174761.1 molecular chaperone HtpG [Fermentimonas sp.]MDI9625510.1 molecular chaperone HtpG [Bacteroidota bacterium]TAH60363.1 MAG: molecular chaperone HtpG [Fermentimonas caenicola]MBP6196349.1 molecular chaperone HtpG [Fermentimonas sp.]MBP7105321.1 molecular chaperone HtpG [Fermentimonas sp.]